MPSKSDVSGCPRKLKMEGIGDARWMNEKMIVRKF